jgi:hypothetical protein
VSPPPATLRSILLASLLLPLLGGPAIASQDPAQVLAWYPSTQLLPANHLKFYIHFSQPMQPGHVLDHFTLLDLTTGQTVPEPFRETELWDDTHQRLTLWFHPGRQKTGVNLNLEIGPILIEGHRYELRLAPTLRTASGQPLAHGSLKRFLAGPPRSHQLSLADWTFPAPPDPGTQQPLTLRFPAPLDHAQLLRCITLRHTPTQTDLPGQITLSADESALTFTPSTPWPDPIHLTWQIRSLLEDLAGNSLARPFQVDLHAPPPHPAPQQWSIPVVRP